MPLLSSLSSYSQDVYTTLNAFFEQQQLEAATIDDSLVQSLDQLERFTMRGGKAIRPFLVHLGYQLAAGKPHDGLLKAAASVELHHKHLLILDDIADRDEERYGGPTVEYAYRDIFAHLPDSNHRALSFAMLDGEWLGTLSKELLGQSGFATQTLFEVIHILNTIMYRDTLAGWQIHGLQCMEPLSQSTPQRFIKGLELVTARYTFEGPLLIGLALAGNKDKKLRDALITYSKLVGTAFQIQDDILGLFGDTNVTGKPVGNDVREGKKTLLLQIAYQRASENDKHTLEAACGKATLTEKEIQEVQRIVTETGSLEYSTTLATDMASQGKEAICSLPDSEQKELLLELATYVVARDK